ncbi:pinensin family lanthipeptide [Ekhidna sp.]
MKTKLTLEDLKVESFVTHIEQNTLETIKGGSSHQTDENELCYGIYPRPFHLDENDMP